MSFTEADARALTHAAEVARRGTGFVEPNPRVGAVLHREGTILAAGWHREFGEAHAERDLLEAWTEEVPPDATLVVTLEPCSSEAKQPPCVRAILERRVRRVVVGEVDPDARHQGRALATLREAGVDVVLAPKGLTPDDLLADFRAHLQRDRPTVVLKWATSLDGHWAPPPGEGRAVSGPDAARLVHRLRAHVDGILVGSGTVLADDPRLTARPRGRRPLVRVVLDGRGRLPSTSVLATSASEEDPVWWVTQGDRSLPGVRVLDVASSRDLEGEVLPQLRREGVQRLLVEGGPTVAGAFLDAACVDHIWVFVAPVLFGSTRSGPVEDRSTRPLGPGLGWSAILRQGPCRFQVDAIERAGDDAWFRLRATR